MEDLLLGIAWPLLLLSLAAIRAAVPYYLVTTKATPAFSSLPLSRSLCCQKLLCVMLWRAVKSPWRPTDFVLLRCTNLDPAHYSVRHLPKPIFFRKIHDAATSSGSSVPIARHVRLLDNTRPNSKTRCSESVKITGLVRSVRKQKKIAFARVADGSTLSTIQAVFPDPALAKEYVK